MYTDNYFNRFELAPEVAEALKKCKCIAYAETKEELQEMAYGPTHTSRYDVVYPIEGLGTVKEAEVVRCKNGCVVNFMEDYMRRRDPNSMAIGDELPTDKPRFRDRFGYEFSKLRQETLDWLSNQQIVMLPFERPRLPEPDDLPDERGVLRALARQYAGLREHRGRARAL